MTRAAAPTPSLGLASYTLWRRELTRFFRQRSRVAGAFLTPVVFWLLLGSGLSSSFRAAGAPEGLDYLEYFFPGIVVLILMFTAIFATISVIQDRKEGFLQGILVAPVPRAAIVLGKVAGGATLAVLQAGLLILLAPLAGVPVDPSRLPAHFACLFLVAAGLTAFGFCLAWPMDSIQGFHAVMNLVLMPMWMLSGAFFPTEPVPAWLALAIRLNPLTYGLAAARRTFGGAGADLPGLPSLELSLAVSIAFLAASLWLGTRLASGEPRRRA